MPLVIFDRVRETTVVTGTNDATLLGAVTGFQSFSVVGNGNTTYYTISDQAGVNFEVGIGTYSTSGPTLARTTVLSSSNAGNKVSFGAGTKDVFLTYPSSRAVYLDGSDNVQPALGAVVASQVNITAQGDLRLEDTTGGQYVALQAPGTLAANYTLTLPVDDGSSGQVLTTDGSGVLSWSTDGGGDVDGPASATDNAVARFDLTTGKLIQNSVVTIADNGTTLINTATNTNSSILVANGTISETVSGVQYLVASQFDVGTAPNDIPLNQYLGTLAYQSFVPYNGVGSAAPTIASATTIAPQTPIIFVSGTTAIVNITPPASIVGGGQLTIIPTGIFTTTTAGNIALASTAVVSRALIMVWDATANKFYPSY